ncbi:GNAT family protein [soil metagenome]
MNDDFGEQFVVHFTHPIETERLLLRPYEASDLDALADLLSVPEVMRYLFEEPLSREEAAATLHRRIPMRKIEQEGDRLALVVTLREGATVIGTVNLTLRSEENRQGEIGYVFHPDHQGRGYATEATRALLDFGFRTGRFHRIYGRCDARNISSARLMERLGMRREAHFVENEWFKGAWGSEFVYAMLMHEWEAG